MIIKLAQNFAQELTINQKLCKYIVFNTSWNTCFGHSMDSSTQSLLTLASERYTIYFDIEDSLDMSVYKTTV